MKTPVRQRLRYAILAALIFGVLVTSACTATQTPQPTSTASPGAGLVPATTSPPTPGNVGELEDTYVAVIRKVLPSVVLIKTQQGLGSGVVFDDQGHIVTNAHVVGDARTFQVTASGRTAPMSASLVGSSPANDLAVIKVDAASSLPAATFGDSSQLQVGDIVLAIGNPLGLSSSVTNGIVSALGRTVSEPASNGSAGATLPDVIQTSADINPGNSGGALVDLDAQVVGIPTLAATDPELGGSAPGIGFAISSNVVKDIAGQLIEHGKVVDSHRAALGVSVTTATDNSGKPIGVGIVKIQQGGAAAAAGLKAGQVITSVDGQPTPTVQALTVVLANLKPGQQVPVEMLDPDGQTSKVTVTLGQLPG